MFEHVINMLLRQWMNLPQYRVKSQLSLSGLYHLLFDLLFTKSTGLLRWKGKLSITDYAGCDTESKISFQTFRLSTFVSISISYLLVIILDSEFSIATGEWSFLCVLSCRALKLRLNGKGPFSNPFADVDEAVDDSTSPVSRLYRMFEISTSDIPIHVDH